MKSQIPNPKPQILIAGAGPAGASLAIRLAQKNFRVTLIERELFPREKLCGEFISPECFAHFQMLGVLDEMLAAGGDAITETFFYAANGKSVGVPSEWFYKGASALGLSRAEMDFRLLEQVKKCGVEVLEETTVTNLLYENEKVCGVRAKRANGATFEIKSDLTIDATGRAGVLSKLAEKEQLRITNYELRNETIRTKDKGQRTKDKIEQIQNPKSKIQNRLVGFKAHLQNAAIEPGRCEIYFFPGGYGGLNLIENDLSNHCFLVRADVVKRFDGNADKIVREIVFQNTRAAAMLENAEPVYDWLAVAVDGFGLKNLNPAANLFAVGDAGAFIDPFTGSGMLMALESGEIFAAALEKSFLSEQIASVYKNLHRQKFQRRLRICALMRRAAFVPNLAGVLISALNFGKLPRRILARATRAPLFSSK